MQLHREIVNSNFQANHMLATTSNNSFLRYHRFKGWCDLRMEFWDCMGASKLNLISNSKPPIILTTHNLSYCNNNNDSKTLLSFLIELHCFESNCIAQTGSIGSKYLNLPKKAGVQFNNLFL